MAHSTDSDIPLRPRVLHLIQQVAGGGAARAMIALASHSRRLGGPEHAVVSLQPADATGIALVKQAGLQMLDHPAPHTLHRAMAEADIVLIHWWNYPEAAALFQTELPPMRLAAWIQVGGYHAPYLLTPSLVNFVDMAVACCEHTYANPAISSLPEETRRQRAAMVFCGAEFGRIGTTTPKAHPDFQVSYIGTVDPTKMHPGFVAMSSAVNVPQVRFVVCGGGGTQWLTAEAQQLGSLERFDFRGAVEDIASVLATTDVYGYPLCEDTYAAAEMNIQEAMYAGIPVVAFPHGGLKNLILHGETGLLVNSPDEYARAIEYLYQNPAERTRLGANAAAYARLHFGAEITGRGFNEVFQRMLLQPKRTRRWPDWPGDALPSELIMNPGARLFVESLGAAGRPYADSALAPTTTEKLKAEEDILSQTLLTHYCCSYGYAKTFPRDSLLQLWSGLGFMARSHFTDALEAFRQAQKNGFNHWRLNWYAAVAAEKIGQAGEAMRLLQPVLQTAPDFEPARKMQQSLPMVQLLPEQSKAALQWVQEAQRLLQARQLVQAREYLERAHNLIPEQILIIELLADLDCRLGRLDSARQLIDIIVKREPQRANPRLAAIKSALAVREKAGTPVPA